jgi:hypothetical protein
LSINALQLGIIRIGLDMEIETWDKGRLQLSRESAYQSLCRLIGVPTSTFGRGKQARINARRWVHETEVLNGIESSCEDATCSCIEVARCEVEA